MARCATCHRRLLSGRPCPVHGGQAGTVDPSPIGAPPVDNVLGIPLVGALGAGGFASVWTLADGRVVKLAHVGHDLARARMAREAEAMVAVGTPAVPGVHGTGMLADGRAWIVMDKVVGQTLTAITADGAQKITDAISIAIAILDSVARIHAAGFVHRDLKPDNLVRLEDGHVVVLDLGLARKIPTDPDDPTRANVQVGSLEYMPPEQIADSASVDERSDLYAVGCILYELLAGRPPFVGDAAVLERAHAALRPPRLGAIATVPATVDALVADLLAKERTRRPPTAAAARARLVSARDEPTLHTRAAQPSIIRASRQPVVLLWVELPRVDRALLAMFGARRLLVASQRGRRVVAGVIGGEHADPASIAIAAAHDFAAAGARVALHLEALHVVNDKLEGEAVTKPETWLPEGAWTGIVLTRALATVVQAATRETAPAQEFYTLVEGDKHRTLIGRDALLGDLVADAAVALGAAPRGPAFGLLVGDAGVGKTAVASELAERLRAIGVRVQLATVPAPGSGKPSSFALATLVGAPAGPIVRAVGDALRAAARDRPTAVILDDLHLADHELLDALEYATLGGEPLPLWVLGVASPRIETRRPQLGSRADRHLRRVLPPLDEDAAVALAAALLEPAEYPPLRALRRLVAIAQGNPLHLAMLAREIHDKGAIRERAGGAHFLDTSALDELAPVALGPWLAARELAGLADELVALARLCAVLGDDVQRDELVAIVDAVESTGGATTTIDVDVGIAELVRAGVLTAGALGSRFQQALVEEGVYATTDPDERLALHRAALAYWRDAKTAGAAERVARHAEAAGDREAAAAAFATLGERAHAEQRPLDADQAWSGALRSLDRGVAMARALVGRARARYRLQRMHDALADLDAAIAIAVESGDRTLEVVALIEKATVLDHTEDFAGSKAVAARARTRLEPGDAPLVLALDLADARALFREQRMAEAADALRRVLAAASAADQRETATIAALLLGPVLAELRELDEAERVFADMIELCWAHDDRFHLAAAYGNRAWLWSARGAIDKTEEDLRLVIQLARESGQAHFERVAAYNLGEDRLWQGLHAEAVQLARRSLALQTTASEGGGTRLDRLLLARALAANGELGELGAVLATFGAESLAGDDLATVAVLQAAADRDLAAALPALDALAHIPTPNRLELLRLLAPVLTPALRDEAHRIAAGDPIWSRRISEF